MKEKAKSLNCCPYVHTILSGLAYALIMNISGYLVWSVLFGDSVSASSYLWRDMDGRFWTLWMPIATFMIGIAVSISYYNLFNHIKSEGLTKGLKFGFMLWLILGLGHGTFWYTISPVSSDLLFAAWIDSAITNILGCIAIALIYGTLPAKSK